MKNAVLLMLGVGIGFFAAHQFNKTAQGKDFFATVGEKAREFNNALVEGYRTRETELTAQHTTPGQYADR
ncbi:hypothetical protein GCM10027052_28800 [Parafrigoribacterium mesophilum]|uniref:hypothetical protein n=1 Tax=Parafrigoribacterium mesophilum TaxID=433646 RepID=UPI0031FE1559